MHVATRASVLLLGVLLFVQLSLSRPSWGWTLEGHHLIALDALSALSATDAGSTRRSCVGDPGGRGGARFQTRCPSQDYYQGAASDTSTSEDRGGRRAPAAGHIRARDDPSRRRFGQGHQRSRDDASAGGLNDVLFVLGQATHCVQDLNQPLHVAW